MNLTESLHINLRKDSEASASSGSSPLFSLTRIELEVVQKFVQVTHSCFEEAVHAAPKERIRPVLQADGSIRLRKTPLQRLHLHEL